jgi:hypothetical protein
LGKPDVRSCLRRTQAALEVGGFAVDAAELVEAPAFTTEFKMALTWEAIAAEAKRAAITGTTRAFMDLDFLLAMLPMTINERRAAVVGRFQEARESLQVRCNFDRAIAVCSRVKGFRL